MYETELSANRAQRLADLDSFLRIPSISAMSVHKPDMLRAATWLKEQLASAGMEHAQVVQTEGHPLVVADWLHAGPSAPTVLVYGHYDVQPVDPVDSWESPPFEPTVRDGRLYARGSSDDKGQLMVYIHAFQTMLQADGKLPINVRVLFEGEEEIGSPSLAGFIKNNRSALAADLLLVSDTAMMAPNMPTICCGLRGIACLEVKVTGPKTDLHSGLYGGAVANPLHVLVELLAGLRTSEGRIAVDGFYDGVLELTKNEREAMARLPFYEDQFQEELGVPSLAGEKGYSALERTSIRPTLELNGVWGGYQGEGTKTVIPSEAGAKITCRLVPDQDPALVSRRIADHLKRNCPDSVRLQVSFGDTARPWTCPTDHPALQAAIMALRSTFGAEVALARMGGSIPVVEVFDTVLGLPAVLVAFAPPDSNAHAPNEFLHLGTYELGIAAVSRLCHELVTISER